MRGEYHQAVASSFHQIGMLQQQQGKYMEALHAFHECLKIRIKVLGIEHVQVVATQIDSLVGEIGKLNAAE